MVAVRVRWSESGVRSEHVCSIRTLHNLEPSATDEEVYAAALQFVRKISGSRDPSKANRAVFDTAVDEVQEITRTLVDSLVTAASPKDREIEAAKARQRSADRYRQPGPANGAGR